jgi:hypothetical protein
LVKISASCFSIGTWMRSMFPFSTLSLTKWYLTSICGSRVEHGVFGNTNGTHAITHERYMGTLLTKVTQRVCDPKQLWATTSGSNILSFCGRLGYTRLFARRPRNKRRSQKLGSTRSRFPIDSTPRKVGIRKSNKWKGRGRRVPKTELRSVSKIRLTVCRCEVLGDAWKRAHRHIKNWMSGLVAIKCKRGSIMLWYSFWSTGSLSSSASSVVVVLIGVDRGFKLSILNFLSDEDMNTDTSTSTSTTPASASLEDTLQASLSGPITRARAHELNYILLLKNEGPEELKPIQQAGGPAV